MADLNAFVEKKMKQLISMLQYCGEAAVRYARQNGSYKDHTANLRSSVGYLIVENGQEITKSDFSVLTATEIKKDGKVETHSGDKGAQEGLEFARSIAAAHQKGIVLVVVAGMNYATYVERRGYDVLSGSQLEAESIIKRLIARL